MSNFRQTNRNFQNRTLPIRWMVLCAIMMAFAVGCDEHPAPTQGPEKMKPVNTCDACPSLQPGQDTLKFMNEVRRFVAGHTDEGLMQNELCNNFSSIGLQQLNVGQFLHFFEQDSGNASCGLTAWIMAKILLENGIDAYTYNFGFEGTKVSHMVVLAKHGGRLLILDPYLNYTPLMDDGRPMDIVTLIDHIGQQNLEIRTTTDTVMSEMLFDRRLLANFPNLDSLISTLGCASFLKDTFAVNQYVIKRPLLRCYECARRQTCQGIIGEMEKKLRKETGLESYHEAYVLKIGEVNGADDSQQVDDLIETAIYSQPGLGRRIRGKK